MLFCIQLSFIWLIITKCLTLSEPAVLHSQYGKYYTSSPKVKNAAASTDYKYVLLNNFCKNITCLREEAFRQSST